MIIKNLEITTIGEEDEKEIYRFHSLGGVNTEDFENALENFFMALDSINNKQ